MLYDSVPVRIAPFECTYWVMENRWANTDAPRGNEYDARWLALQAQGVEVHGEADCVEALVQRFGVVRSVIDAGCGTGRVAIELAARGFRVLGIDTDAAMLETAQVKAPYLRWIQADLSAWTTTTAASERFGAVVLAGNVMIFVAPGTEGAVLQSMANTLEPHGILVAGFQVRRDRISLRDYDLAATAAGLDLVERFATWQGEPYTGGDYAVSVHRIASLQALTD